jgi:hypothetical protein
MPTRQEKRKAVMANSARKAISDAKAQMGVKPKPNETKVRNLLNKLQKYYDEYIALSVETVDAITDDSEYDAASNADSIMQDELLDGIAEI